MTYCVALKVGAGMVFASDSRTNAGFDQISTFRKMVVYERPDDRFMVLLSSGNLSISQSVREILQVERVQAEAPRPTTIWNATSMFDAARVLGQAVRHVYDLDGPSLRAAGIDYGCTLIFGGQIAGEAMRLFLVYSTGNFIEATAETCYFQIGESKYGKPVLDRMLVPSTPLADAAKCALVSIDSTLKSNLSVGLPIDLVVYQARRPPQRRHGLHRRGQPLFLDDPRVVGAAPARGVREHRQPQLGRERRALPSGGSVEALRRADQDHRPRGEDGLIGTRRGAGRLARLVPPQRVPAGHGPAP